MLDKRIKELKEAQKIRIPENQAGIRIAIEILENIDMSKLIEVDKIKRWCKKNSNEIPLSGDQVSVSKLLTFLNTPNQ